MYTPLGRGRRSDQSGSSRGHKSEKRVGDHQQDEVSGHGEAKPQTGEVNGDGDGHVRPRQSHAVSGRYEWMPMLAGGGFRWEPSWERIRRSWPRHPAGAGKACAVARLVLALPNPLPLRP